MCVKSALFLQKIAKKPVFDISNEIAKTYINGLQK